MVTSINLQDNLSNYSLRSGIGTGEDFDIFDVTNNTVRLLLKNNGNILINSSTDNGNLFDINGILNSNSFKISNTTIFDSSRNLININSLTSNGNITLTSSSDIGNILTTTGSNASSFRIFSSAVNQDSFYIDDILSDKRHLHFNNGTTNLSSTDNGTGINLYVNDSGTSASPSATLGLSINNSGNISIPNGDLNINSGNLITTSGQIQVGSGNQITLLSSSQIRLGDSVQSARYTLTTGGFNLNISQDNGSGGVIINF